MNRALPNLHCTQCKKLRRWDDIKTYSKWFDCKGNKNMMKRNINYCADNIECYRKAIKSMDKEFLNSDFTYSECQNFEDLTVEEQKKVRYEHRNTSNCSR